jgi:hypothetical protein
MRTTRALIAAAATLALAPTARAGAAPRALPAAGPGRTAPGGTVRDTTSGGEVEAAGPVTRDVGALAPEFRVRLDRVLARMRAEFGGDVEVVETVRSQTRQEALYAQGRTAPGPVVTWTRNSAHLSGFAADLVVGGAYGNGRAYARLAEIAHEEGLRTLRPRDPGHVELAGVAGRAVYASGTRADARAAVAPVGSARALSRIVASRGVPPSEPTVFASSPYAAVSYTPASFLAGAAPDGRDADPE